MNDTLHLYYLRNRVAQTLNGLSRTREDFCGLRYPATMAIYKGVILDILGVYFSSLEPKFLAPTEEQVGNTPGNEFAAYHQNVPKLSYMMLLVSLRRRGTSRPPLARIQDAVCVQDRRSSFGKNRQKPNQICNNNRLWLMTNPKVSTLRKVAKQIGPSRGTYITTALPLFSKRSGFNK